jgi:PEGA domain-containing protein
MNKVAELATNWAVLTRSSGEVLTAGARSPGLYMGLLGVPPGFDSRDAEGWLYDVVGVAHESAATGAAPEAIPALLHHALTGLLFSHAELWEQTGSPSPCSFAFVDTVQEVGFGLVGSAEIALWVDGERREPEWVTVRDAVGREARAWSLPTAHMVRVRMLCRSSGGDPTLSAEVEAEWPASSGQLGPVDRPAVAEGVVGAPEDALALAEAGHASGSQSPGASTSSRVEGILGLATEKATSDESARRGPPDAGADRAETASDVGALAPGAQDGPPERAEVRAEGSAVARLLRRGLTWFSNQRPGAGEDPAGATGAARPTETAVEVGRERAPMSVEGPTQTPLPDLIPPSPEPAAVTESAAPASAGPVDSTAWENPEGDIPPSPEPAELTERAVAWSEPSDPHMVSLPGVTGSGLEETPGDVTSGVSGEASVAIPHGAPPIITAPETAPTLAPAHDPGQTRRLPTPESFYTLPPQRPAWPSAEQLAREEQPAWKRPWLWAALVAVLFAVGWLVGGIQDGGRPRPDGRRGGVGGLLRAVGLGGPKYTVDVTSRPSGAWIAVDGRNLAQRTPSVVDLSPGEHAIGLSFPDLGGASYTVRGTKGDRVPLNATLWGALEIFSPKEVGVIAVTVDGVARGFAPLRADSLTPGVHDVRFSAPGATPWGQTVDVRVGETKDLLARAVQSPATGMLQVQATMTDEQGTQPLKGGQVWVDGEARGVTPLALDLPRGPHSVRLVYKGQEAPIQVIDLPGGNQRFAVFEFGMELDAPRLVVSPVVRVPRDRPVVMSAWLSGFGAPDVREMWLHAETREETWRRYPMALLKAPTGLVGVTVFPIGAFDGEGRTRYYVSAQYGQGDECFTEIRTTQVEANGGR